MPRGSPQTAANTPRTSLEHTTGHWDAPPRSLDYSHRSTLQTGSAWARTSGNKSTARLFSSSREINEATFDSQPEVPSRDTLNDHSAHLGTVQPIALQIEGERLVRCSPQRHPDRVLDARAQRRSVTDERRSVAERKIRIPVSEDDAGRKRKGGAAHHGPSKRRHPRIEMDASDDIEPAEIGKSSEIRGIRPARKATLPPEID